MIANAPHQVDQGHCTEFADVLGQWMVLRTKPRQEKAVGRYLDAAGTTYYLPLVPHRTRSAHGRRLVSVVPLFPGYVFLAGDLEDGYAAVSTHRVCQILRIPDQGEFVREIDQIARALASTGTLAPYRGIVIGQRCRVIHGPFAGIEGTVMEWRGAVRVMLVVATLGQGAALEIELDEIEPID